MEIKSKQTLRVKAILMKEITQESAKRTHGGYLFSFNDLGSVGGLILGKYKWMATSPTPNTDLVAMGKTRHK